MSLSENQDSFDNKAPFLHCKLHIYSLPMQMFTRTIRLHVMKMLPSPRTINWLFSCNELWKHHTQGSRSRGDRGEHTSTKEQKSRASFHRTFVSGGYWGQVVRAFTSSEPLLKCPF